MIVKYNGITLRVTRLLELSADPILDGPTYLYTRHKIAVEAVFSPGATEYASGLSLYTPTPILSIDGSQVGIETMKATVKHALSQPQRTLEIWNGAVLYLISPPRVTDALSGDLHFLICDANNGPIPIRVDVTEQRGQTTLLVRFVVQTDLNQCGQLPGMLSHRWKTQDVVDMDFWTIRRIEGRATFAPGVLAAVGAQSADYFRSQINHPISDHFQRLNVTVELSQDNTQLAYTIEDREVASQLLQFARDYGATRIEISETASTTEYGSQGLIKSIFSNGGSTVGRAVEVAGSTIALAGSGGTAAARAATKASLITAGASLALQALSGGFSMLPFTTIEIRVKVFGQPNSSIKGLLKVCVATWDARLQQIGTNGVDLSISTGADINQRTVEQRVLLAYPLAKAYLGTGGNTRTPKTNLATHQDIIGNLEDSARQVSQDPSQTPTVISLSDASIPGQSSPNLRGASFTEIMIAQQLAEPCMDPRPVLSTVGMNVPDNPVDRLPVDAVVAGFNLQGS